MVPRAANGFKRNTFEQTVGLETVGTEQKLARNALATNEIWHPHYPDGVEDAPRRAL